jgi:YHS domain-containing protein
MIKFLILFGVGYLLYRAMRSWMFPDGSSPKNVSGKSTGQIDDVMIKDPNCGAYFPRRDAVHLNLGGKDLYFCSNECRDQYMARQSEEN